MDTRPHQLTMSRPLSIVLFLLLSWSVVRTGSAAPVVLAKGGVPRYTIVCAGDADPATRFASAELQRYLKEISGADFGVGRETGASRIVVMTEETLHRAEPGVEVPALGPEAYDIALRKGNLYLIGGSGRAVLYAVYSFLSDLGCRWVAPDFDGYHGRNEFVPRRSNLNYVHPGDHMAQPALAYRKLDIEEGRSYTTSNLRALIDWMPKARFNVLVCPMNYQGQNRVEWEHWREALTPELNERDITIEVGGHGYQNFLSADMEGGQLFSDHPAWFGMDEQGNRSPNPQVVFCTSNPDALAFLQQNVLAYLNAHPEIKIFDFWPPDSESWCTCAECQALGSPSDRHALLVSRMAAFLRVHRPDVRLECLAYSRYSEPPTGAALDSTVLVDFCPIQQSFEYPFNDPNAAGNATYNQYLLGWKKTFAGDVSIYSYYRKYAWHSLPVTLPHYMQNDLRYFQRVGADGISVYSEPGDWFTYGLNHFVLGHLAWNPDADVDALIRRYCDVVNGDASETAATVYSDLERVVAKGCSIPHTEPKTTDAYDGYLKVLTEGAARIAAARTKTSSDSVAAALEQLGWTVDYALKDIAINRAVAAGAPDEKIAGLKNDEAAWIAARTVPAVFVERTHTPSEGKKPNIVLIIADDLGFGDLSCYGATKIATPNIDRLASEGTRFDNAYVASSLCTPSRYGFLTGRYPWRTRLTFGVLKYFEKPLIGADETTLATMLRRNGYHTVAVGKWHLGFDWSVNDKAPPNPEESVLNSWDEHDEDYIDFTQPCRNGPITRGFDYFYGMAGSNNMQPYVFIENDHVVEAPSLPQKPYDLYADALRAPDWNIEMVNVDLTTKAVQQINDHFAYHRDQPLFLYFATSAIHRPCLPTFTRGRSQAGLRGDIVEELDWTVKMVIDALKKNGAYDNTMLIFTSDNGPRPGDPAIWMQRYAEGDYEDYHQDYFDHYKPQYINPDGNEIWKNGWFTYGHHASGPYLGFKSDAWDGGFRVPFMVRWPGKVAAGATDNRTVSSVDLMATLADAVGDTLRPGEGPDSYSFYRNLVDSSAPQVRASMVLTAGASGALVVFKDNWKYIEAAPPGRWPETYYPDHASNLDAQLYNLAVDPSEQKNLYRERQDKVEELKALMQRVEGHPGTEDAEMK